MKHYYLYIAVLLIADTLMVSDAALFSNQKILDPTQEIETSSSCQCKNRCFVTPNCTHTSWVQNMRGNAFTCHATNKTNPFFEKAEGWNTYSKTGHCLKASDEIVQNGSVHNTKEGCIQYTCVDSKFVITTANEYNFLPPNEFQYHEGLGCIHFIVDKLKWIAARDHCYTNYTAVLLNIDPVEGVEHIKRYAVEMDGALSLFNWIAARRTTEGGAWMQTFGKNISWNSPLWLNFQLETGDSRGKCTRTMRDNEFYLSEAKCRARYSSICQMEPKTDNYTD